MKTKNFDHDLWDKYDNLGESNEGFFKVDLENLNHVIL